MISTSIAKPNVPPSHFTPEGDAALIEHVLSGGDLCAITAATGLRRRNVALRLFEMYGDFLLEALRAGIEDGLEPASKAQKPIATERPVSSIQTAGDEHKARYAAAIDAALESGRIELVDFVEALSKQGIQVIFNAGDRGNGLSVGGAGFALQGDIPGTYTKGSGIGDAYKWASLQSRGLQVNPEDLQHRETLLRFSRKALLM